ncbi:hypothetical protein [Shewanella denitrificans]|nr:hypothetical protein [Shewanella denitrificans]
MDFLKDKKGPVQHLHLELSMELSMELRIDAHMLALMTSGAEREKN